MEPAAGSGVAAMGGPLGSRPYALVLLDARMPDTDGLAPAAEIRKRAELSATRAGATYPSWLAFGRLTLVASLVMPGEPLRARAPAVGPKRRPSCLKKRPIGICTSWSSPQTFELQLPRSECFHESPNRRPS